MSKSVEDNCDNVLDCAAAGAQLRKANATIVDRWAARCREEVPAAKKTGELSLINSLPEFLEELAKSLLNHCSNAELSENAEIAQVHGEERAELGRYTLDQVIYEYHLLRLILVEEMEATRPLGTHARRLIHAFIDLGIRSAALRFVEISEQRLISAASGEKKAREDSDLSLVNLKEVQHQLARAVAVAGVGFYDWDIVENRIEYSAQMLQEWDLTEGGSLQDALLRVDPRDRERLSSEIRAAMAERKAFFSEYRVVRQDSSSIWVEAQGEITYDDAGNPIRFFGTTLNITERKKNESLLAEERHKLEAIFRDSPAALALWRGENLVFEKVNPAFQKIFGTRKLTGRPLLEAIPELRYQMFPMLLQEVWETGKTFVGRERLAQLRSSDDGPLEDRYYDFAYVRVNDGEGNAYGVYDHSVDVTDRVLNRRILEEKEQQLQEVVEDLKKERELRERFVATLSHDLRSPMAAAKLNAQMIGRLGDLPPTLAKQVDRTVSNLDRADRMIQRLLDVTRVQAGQPLQLFREECSLDKVISDVVGELEAAHAGRVRFHPLQPVHGAFDSDGIRRLVENLISNALKYGADDRPVTIGLLKLEADIVISVHNEGNPLGEAERRDIFHPFQRAFSAERGKQKGWGLGLALVRAMAEAHGGRVQVESGEGVGTTFSVILPLSEAVA